MQRVLVLGSAGQIGKPLCNYLKAQGDSVVEVDIVNSLDQDIRNPDFFSRFTEPFSFCHFLAWDVGGSHYLEKKDSAQDFIFNNMKIVLSAFQYLSTAQTPFLFYTSQMSNMLHSSYGLLKNIGEKLAASTPYGTTIKLWNVYGHETDANKFHVVTDFLNAAISTGRIQMKTNGAETRQLLFVDDLVKTVYAIQKMQPECQGEVIDYSTGWDTSILDVARICAEVVEKHSGKKVEVIPGKGSSIQAGYRNVPDLTLANRLGLPMPSTLVADGIERVYLEMMKCRQQQTTI